MYSLELLFLISLVISQLLIPLPAYILPVPFQNSMASFIVDLQGYLSDSEAYEGNDIPVIRPDLSEERDDGGRILTFKCC